MNSWKVILATMVIFGTGVVTGGLLVGHFQSHPTPRPPGQGVGPNPGKGAQVLSPGGMRVDLLRRMVRDLDLTPDQRDRVDKILKESQERTRKVMAPFMRDEWLRTTAQFRDVLTPEQQPRFDELMKEKQQQRGRDQRRGPPTGDHPSDWPRTNNPALTNS